MAYPPKSVRRIDHLRRYLDRVAQQNGFSVGREYWKQVAKQRGFRSYDDFQAMVTRRFRRFDCDVKRAEKWSERDWMQLVEGVQLHHRGRKRQRHTRPRNQHLSRFIRRRLQRLGKNQQWLARKIGVSKQAVHQYIRGTAYPRKPILTRLLENLSVAQRRQS